MASDPREHAPLLVVVRPSPKVMRRLLVVATVEVVSVLQIANFWDKGYLLLCGVLSTLWILLTVGVGVSLYRWLFLRRELVL